MKSVINKKHKGKKEYMTKLIDIDDLADYLKLKRQTLYNWLNQGKISGMKVGGVWRFDRREVDLWLKSRRRSVKSGDRKL